MEIYSCFTSQSTRITNNSALDAILFIYSVPSPPLFGSCCFVVFAYVMEWCVKLFNNFFAH